MREIINPQGIANRVRLKRSQYRGTFLIVEGDTDSRIFRNFLAEGQCQIIIANNKDNVLRALTILESERFVGLLAIVDADFDRLEGLSSSSSNLHFTDTHDLETMILQSPALEKVLAEFGSENKIDGFVSRHNSSLRLILLISGSHLGYLRWLSLQHQLGLRFEELSFSKFLNNETLEIEVVKLVKTVKDHSSAHHLKDSELQEQMQRLYSDDHDLWQVCCGHDLVGILSAGLRKTLGSNDSKQVEQEVISRALRLAYEFTHFRSTQLYVAIQDWEKANPPYQVFPSLAA